MEKIPESAKNSHGFNTQRAFTQKNVAVTHDLVVAFKPNLAFYISIGITTVLSFLYGWIKTGYNVGWSGWGNVLRCARGGVVFFGVVAVAAVLSVVITRGIDHNL